MHESEHRGLGTKSKILICYTEGESAEPNKSERVRHRLSYTGRESEILGSGLNGWNTRYHRDKLALNRLQTGQNIQLFSRVKRHKWNYLGRGRPASSHAESIPKAMFAGARCKSAKRDGAHK